VPIVNRDVEPTVLEPERKQHEQAIQFGALVVTVPAPQACGFASMSWACDTGIGSRRSTPNSPVRVVKPECRWESVERKA